MLPNLAGAGGGAMQVYADSARALQVLCDQNPAKEKPIGSLSLFYDFAYGGVGAGLFALSALTIAKIVFPELPISPPPVKHPILILAVGEVAILLSSLSILESLSPKIDFKSLFGLPDAVYYRGGKFNRRPTFIDVLRRSKAKGVYATDSLSDLKAKKSPGNGELINGLTIKNIRTEKKTENVDGCEVERYVHVMAEGHLGGEKIPVELLRTLNPDSEYARKMRAVAEGETLAVLGCFFGGAFHVMDIYPAVEDSK